MMMMVCGLKALVLHSAEVKCVYRFKRSWEASENIRWIFSHTLKPSVCLLFSSISNGAWKQDGDTEEEHEHYIPVLSFHSRLLCLPLLAARCASLSSSPLTSFPTMTFLREVGDAVAEQRPPFALRASCSSSHTFLLWRITFKSLISNIESIFDRFVPDFSAQWSVKWNVV